MKDLLSFIVTNLVTKPDAVSVEENSENGSVNLNLTVDPSDMGIIIGKGGQTIRSIRRLLTVRAIAESVRVNLQLAEPQGESRVESQSFDNTQDDPERSLKGQESSEKQAS